MAEASWGQTIIIVTIIYLTQTVFQAGSSIYYGQCLIKSSQQPSKVLLQKLDTLPWSLYPLYPSWTLYDLQW